MNALISSAYFLTVFLHLLIVLLLTTSIAANGNSNNNNNSKSNSNSNSNDNNNNKSNKYSYSCNTNNSSSNHASTFFGYDIRRELGLLMTVIALSHTTPYSTPVNLRSLCCQ